MGEGRMSVYTATAELELDSYYFRNMAAERLFLSDAFVMYSIFKKFSDILVKLSFIAYKITCNACLSNHPPKRQKDMESNGKQVAD